MRAQNFTAMNRSGKPTRQLQLNRTDRHLWTSKNGDGTEGLDYADYLVFDPSQKTVEQLVATLTSDKIVERILDNANMQVEKQVKPDPRDL